jgi:hypothetical protein
MTQRSLPIYDIESDLVKTLAGEPRLILTAPTGSGKSTQVPQMLLDHGLLGAGEVVVLQPRRLAARLLAARVAEHPNSPAAESGSDAGTDAVGSQVQCRVRPCPAWDTPRLMPCYPSPASPRRAARDSAGIHASKGRAPAADHTARNMS